MNLKFHHPKKDTCGLRETYISSDDKKKEELQQDFDKHILEKERVRLIKATAKEKASSTTKYVAAVFDLQSVIYLPQSQRSELFYKRRLACYNFTIFDLASKEGYCFLSNEGQTRRGSCELSSYLHQYLQILDDRGIEFVDLFSDGCVGQNKNSYQQCSCPLSTDLSIYEM